ncbi:MAG: hypothetical protein HXP04_07525 [Trueperella pyogenes]|nr:hypothetical protein [Trueperella pyogenes]
MRTSSVLVVKGKSVPHVRLEQLAPSVNVVLAQRSLVDLIVLDVRKVAEVLVPREAVPKVAVQSSLTAHASLLSSAKSAKELHLPTKECATRKKVKELCGLMIASASVMRRVGNMFAVSELSASRPSPLMATSRG